MVVSVIFCVWTSQPQTFLTFIFALTLKITLIFYQFQSPCFYKVCTYEKVYNVFGSYSGTRFFINYSSCLRLRLWNGQLPSAAQAQIVPSLKQLRLKSTLLLNTKQIDKTWAHVEKKNHLEIKGTLMQI